MIEHLLSHVLGQAAERRIDTWVAAGQRTEAVSATDGTGYHLTFGFGYRLQNVLTCLTFGIFSSLALWYHLFVQPLGSWLLLAYAGILFPAFALSLFLAIGVHTTRITVSRDGITFRHFGFDSIPLDWSQITSVYRSPVTPSIVLVLEDGRRVRISTQLDGLRALAESFAYVAPGVVHPSIVNWMITLR